MSRKQVVILALIIILFFILKYFGFFHYLSLHAMRENADRVAHIVEEHYTFSVVAFIFLYSLIIMIAIPGFAPLTMVGGYLFGTVAGSIYSLCGSFMGSVISYSLVKLFLHDYIVRKYGTSITLFTNYVHKYGIANALLILHFLTIVPFFLINSFAAIFGVSTFTFMWTTLFGSLPMIILYSFAGQKLHEVEQTSSLFSPTILLVFVFLILCALLPMVIKYFTHQQTEKKR